MKKISLIALFAALVMSVNATDIWTGDQHVSWSGGVQIQAAQFADAVAGQKIVVSFNEASDGIEFKVMNQFFDHLAGSREAAWISGDGAFEQFLTQTAVDSLKGMAKLNSKTVIPFGPDISGQTTGTPSNSMQRVTMVLTSAR